MRLYNFYKVISLTEDETGIPTRVEVGTVFTTLKKGGKVELMQDMNCFITALSSEIKLKGSHGLIVERERGSDLFYTIDQELLSLLDGMGFDIPITLEVGHSTLYTLQNGEYQKQLPNRLSVTIALHPATQVNLHDPYVSFTVLSKPNDEAEDIDRELDEIWKGVTAFRESHRDMDVVYTVGIPQGNRLHPEGLLAEYIKQYLTKKTYAKVRVVEL